MTPSCLTAASSTAKAPAFTVPMAAELTKMATLAFGKTVPASVSAAPFGDVATGAWYAPFITVAKQLGMVEGFPGNLFKPNNAITRAEALKIILEAAGTTVVESNTSFINVAAGAWYVPYVTFAADQGIVSGYGDGRFGPDNSVTRAEIAKIIVQALGAQGR